MRRPWIFAGLFILTLGTITAIAFWAPDRGWDRRDDRVEVVQVVDPDGNLVEGGATIVVDRDRHGFPFGLLLVPLFIFLVLGLVRGPFRGPGGGGPWDPDGDHRGRWLDEWHVRQHQEMERTATPQPTEPAS